MLQRFLNQVRFRCLEIKDETSKENRFEGGVNKIEIDVQNAKVAVDIGNHDTIISVLDLRIRFKNLKLR